MQPADHDRIPFPADMPTKASHMGCCGIIATALFTGAGFNDVWDTIRRAHRKPGNWQGGTRHNERLTAIRKLNHGRSVAFKTERMTLRRWINLHARDNVTYMVRTTKHIQVVRNGFVYDQGGCRSILDHPGSGKMVQWAMARK